MKKGNKKYNKIQREFTDGFGGVEGRLGKNSLASIKKLIKEQKRLRGKSEKDYKASLHKEIGTNGLGGNDYELLRYAIEHKDTIAIDVLLACDGDPNKLNKNQTETFLDYISRSSQRLKREYTDIKELSSTLQKIRNAAERIKSENAEYQIRKIDNKKIRQIFKLINLGDLLSVIDSVENYLLANKWNNIKFEGKSPLIFSIALNRRDIAIALLDEFGAEITAKEKKLSLLLAAKFGNLDIIKHIFELEGYDINIKKENSGNNLLHIASLFAHDELVEYFIREGVEINASNNNGNQPIELAIERANESIVNILLKHVDAKDYIEFAKDSYNQKIADNTVSLIRSAKDIYQSIMINALEKAKDNLSELETIIDDNQDLAPDLNFLVGEMTLLHKLVLNEGIDTDHLKQIINLLVSKGANLNIGSSDNASILAIAKKKEIKEFLYQKGARFTENEKRDYIEKIKSGNTGSIQTFIASYPKEYLNELTEFAETAIEHDQQDILELIVNSGNINNKTKNDTSLLHIAILKQKPDIAIWLLDNGIDISADNKGNTGLHCLGLFPQMARFVEIFNKIIAKDPSSYTKLNARRESFIDNLVRCSSGLMQDSNFLNQLKQCNLAIQLSDKQKENFADLLLLKKGGNRKYQIQYTPLKSIIDRILEAGKINLRDIVKLKNLEIEEKFKVRIEALLREVYLGIEEGIELDDAELEELKRFKYKSPGSNQRKNSVNKTIEKVEARKKDVGTAYISILELETLVEYYSETTQLIDNKDLFQGFNSSKIIGLGKTDLDKFKTRILSQKNIEKIPKQKTVSASSPTIPKAPTKSAAPTVSAAGISPHPIKAPISGIKPKPIKSPNNNQIRLKKEKITTEKSESSPLNKEIKPKSEQLVHKQESELLDSPVSQIDASTSLAETNYSYPKTEQKKEQPRKKDQAVKNYTPKIEIQDNRKSRAQDQKASSNNLTTNTAAISSVAAGSLFLLVGLGVVGLLLIGLGIAIKAISASNKKDTEEVKVKRINPVSAKVKTKQSELSFQDKVINERNLDKDTKLLS